MFRTIRRTGVILAYGLVLSFLWILTGWAHLADTGTGGVVQTAGGAVSGTPGLSPGIRVFKGIPFAAPPVGDLRWRPPQPPAPWEGVRKAEVFGPQCMQAPRSMGGPFKDTRKEQEPISEDCLYLNIWTPAKSSQDRRPVMVWIYGGGFHNGAGSLPYYDGENLAKKGVVVVNFNYRLGIFGFMAHPDLVAESPQHSAGNYALLDAVAALKWVRENISAFGGDPGRVTIFGESAGSSAVSLLIASPLAKDLFQRAIGESGAAIGSMGPRPLTRASEQGVKFAESVGAHSISELRAMSADKIYAAGEAFARQGRGGGPGGRGGMGANLDGWFLPDSPYNLYLQGKQNPVQLIAGSNASEGSWGEPVSAQNFIDQAKQRFGDKAEDYLKLYPADPADSKDKVWRSEIFTRTDQVAGATRTWVQLQAQIGQKSYFYYLSRVPPMPDHVYRGAFHGADIFYVFGSMNYRPEWAWTPIDTRLAEIMSSYWVNFATRGDPNGRGLPKWPAYDVKTHKVMEFGDKVKAGQHPRQAGIDFNDAFLAKQRSAGERSGGN